MALSPVAAYYVPHQYKHFESQIHDVISAVESREKVVLLLRGLPGSGKSTFANVLISCLGQGEICSADSYFYDQQGNYRFSVEGLQYAHEDCRRQVQKAMENNEALVIVDNTNIEKWQMVPYAKMAVKHGYHIILLEPNTAWRRNVHQLSELNTHGIPKAKITELKRRYEAVTVSSLVPSKQPASQMNTRMSVNSNQALPQRPRRKPRTDRPSQDREPSGRSSSAKDSHEGIPSLYSGRQHSAADYHEGVSSLQLGSSFQEWRDSVLAFKSGKSDLTSSVREDDTSLSSPANPSDRQKTGIKIKNNPNDPNAPENLTAFSGNPQPPSRPRMKKKKNVDDKLRSTDYKAMFEPVRAMTEVREWSQLPSYGLEMVASSFANMEVKDERKGGALKPASNVDRVDADTCITEFDEVLLNGDVVDDLAADLGYQTLEPTYSRLNLKGDDTNVRKPSVEIDPELMSRISMFQNKGTQTDTSEDRNDVPSQSFADSSSVDPALESLCKIFPNKSASELSQVLDQTKGDVEWAAEVCLQLDSSIDILQDSDLVADREDVAQASAMASLSLDPPSRHSPISSNLSSPRLSESSSDSSDTPRLALSKEFIHRAHRMYGEEFKAQDLDVDLLPSGLYEDWVPPADLVKKIYASYLEFLGLKSSPPASEVESPPIIRHNLDNVSVSSDDSSGNELCAKNITASSPVCRRTDNGFRGIMQEEEDIEKVMTEKRKTLVSDVASRLKFDRLRAQYPHMEEHLLMDIFISFECNEEATSRHLRTLGHTPAKQAPIPDEENESENEFLFQTRGRLWETKEELIHERENLSRRKETLTNQLRQMMDNKKTKVATPYYIEELKSCNRQLQTVKEKIRNIRLAEQTYDHLDLHHFTLPEAMKSLKERLEILASSKKRVLTVFTGVGRHSAGAAKLRPAVKQFLTQKTYKFKEVRDGVFQINL